MCKESVSTRLYSNLRWRSSFNHKLRQTENRYVEKARDLFQDLLMAIFYNTQKKDFELTCAFSTYLFSVCRNLWFKELRQRKLEYSRVDTDS
ncbi:MAG: sigma factor, partial [Bacteroidota bacterium]